MDSKTAKILVSGVVQGVGMRPFVYMCAQKNGVVGYVSNTSRGISIVAQGDESHIDSFLSELKSGAPEAAIITGIEIETFKTSERFSTFEIRASESAGAKDARISPDLPVCEDCLAELFDPGNRRYLYPYINCSHCGPRYTIVLDVPYDRNRTTMSGFEMCPDCRAEYGDPHNRRFHAQPDACYTCGPRLALAAKAGESLGESGDPESSASLFARVAGLVSSGAIMAIKGLGGFHLACDATNGNAVSRLRRSKYREAKPFAVMVKDMREAKKLVRVSVQEATLLASGKRPIVLLEKKEGSSVACEVAPATRLLGLMLPYTPVQALLFNALDIPLVMTSANLCDEPIAYEDKDALSRLAGIADYFLLGDREIYTRCDDSVVRAIGEDTYPIRRSRGYVPNPVILPKDAHHPILGLGAEQKNTICFASGSRAILSHHIGDLDNPAAFRSFEESIFHLAKLLSIRPEAVAYDLHPEYHNTKYILSRKIKGTFLDGLPSVGIQHHHAHVASCMADNGITGEVIGVALDGTGFGTDGTIWGGEIFVADEKKFSRAASIVPARMPGGEAAVRKPWRMALSYLSETFGDQCVNRVPESWLNLVTPDELSIALYQLKSERESPLTSSCGRLFDGVAALAGICIDAAYEGQPAIELEQTAINLYESRYFFSIYESSDLLYISWKDAVEAISKDIASGVTTGEISAKFHYGLSDALIRAVSMVSRKTGINRAVLGGGCFMNAIILSRLVQGLSACGISVFTHKQVPPNDGGISLGQCYIAASILE